MRYSSQGTYGRINLPRRLVTGEQLSCRTLHFPTMLELTLNGERRSFSEISLSVAGLIDQLGYTGKRIAVERNGEIVPKSQHGSTLLASGDQLEIVVAVGGG